jgi:oxygen-independent coproporphyrinogen-3 oxidase
VGYSRDYEKWRERLNFYAFIAALLGEGDIYVPTEFYKPLFISQVVKSWEKAVNSILTGKAPKQLGIFIFVPFCKSKCIFCPFFSLPLSSRSQLDNFTASLLKEMSLFKGIFKGVQFNTVWFGGGTPSILEESHFKKIFEVIFKLFSLSKDCQITVECSPSSLTSGKLKLFKSLGVNRITIGLQSLNKRVLMENNRLFQDIKYSLELLQLAKKIGIGVVNVDLMCGLPGDNFESFKDGLKRIIAMRPDLIQINPFFPSYETNFFKFGGEYSPTDILRRTQEAKTGIGFLEKAGYRKVDGANLGYARIPGVANQQEIDKVEYNSSVLSFGPASHAHAFAQLQYTNQYTGRNWNQKLLPKYLGIKLNLQEEMRRFIIVHLRKPILRAFFRQLFGRDIVESFFKELREIQGFDLFYVDNQKLLFKIRTRQEQLILAKHFFNSNYLYNLQKIRKVRFRKDKNYFSELNKLIDVTI